MAYAHLINCLLLSFGPFFVIYRAKNLSDYNAFFVCIFAGLTYVLTTTCKMIILASLLSSYSTQEANNVDISFEFLKNAFNLIDLLGIYILLKYKWSSLDDQFARIIAIALGWNFVESVLGSFFYFFMHASGDEFSWKYIYKAMFNNMDLLEVIITVAFIVAISKEIRIRNNFKSINLSVISILIIKAVVLPTICSHIQNNYYDNMNENILFVKAAFVSGFYFFGKTQKIY